MGVGEGSFFLSDSSLLVIASRFDSNMLRLCS